MLRNVHSAEADHRIFVLLKQGDQQAIGLLYDKYAPALFAIIARITDNEQKAEVILHRVFINAWNLRDAYNSSGLSLFTWLINMARQSAFDAGKPESAKNLSGSNPVYEASENGIKEDLAFDLVYYKGLTISEVATLLHLPVSAVTTNIRMAIQERQEKKLEA